MRFLCLGTALALTIVTPAFAEEADPPKDLTVTGTVALLSDYRFRGVSQSDEEGAVQGSVTITHKSGFYGGFFASNLAGWGTFGGSNLELDLIGGYARPLGGGTIDVGLTYYMYPGGFSETDFGEAYAKLSGTVGPVKLLAGVAYAPQQEALGNAQITANPNGRPGDKEDNLYLWGDFSGGIPNTPVTLKAHIGYSDGNPGLGPNGTSVAPTGKYFDWGLGVDATFGKLTFGLAYTDTDITEAQRQPLLPNFASTKDGSSISSEQIIFSVTAAF